MKIEIDKDFLEILLNNEMELWNIAYNQNPRKQKLLNFYQENINKINELLNIDKNTEKLKARDEIDNKRVEICRHCKEHYCIVCSENEGWEDFCSDECQQEYNKELLDFKF